MWERGSAGAVFCSHAERLTVLWAGLFEKRLHRVEITKSSWHSAGCAVQVNDMGEMFVEVHMQPPAWSQAGSYSPVCFAPLGAARRSVFGAQPMGLRGRASAPLLCRPHTLCVRLVRGRTQCCVLECVNIRVVCRSCLVYGQLLARHTVMKPPPTISCAVARLPNYGQSSQESELWTSTCSFESMDATQLSLRVTIHLQGQYLLQTPRTHVQV